MKKPLTHILLVLIAAFASYSFMQPEWGFFGHKKINRMAVFTLPSDLIGFYKQHIEFVTDHAVDPDKRRYATKFEAVRHYIDIDHWGVAPFENVPRDFASAFLKFSELQIVENNGDTNVYKISNCWSNQDEIFNDFNILCAQKQSLFEELISPNYYEDIIRCGCNDLAKYTDNGALYLLEHCKEVVFRDKFSEYGVLPYWLPQIYYRLVQSFADHNEKRILRYSADIGHYIGDAHVPLHTTENYNGQLTDQIGIHAFWESRLPELFANEQYDFFVGKAEYIDDIYDYSWKVVLESHNYLDEVLAIERRLSHEYPEDQQYCFDERNERTVKTQCRDYSEAYHMAMDGMVEKRMTEAIRAIGSFWYSAWIDAGQPKLDFSEVSWTKEDEKKSKTLEQQFKTGNIKGREHGSE